MLKLTKLTSSKPFSLLQTFVVPEPREYRKLYVENLATSWEEDEIEARFKQLGKVEQIYLIKNKLAQSTGKGSVLNSFHLF